MTVLGVSHKRTIIVLSQSSTAKRKRLLVSDMPLDPVPNALGCVPDSVNLFVTVMLTAQGGHRLHQFRHGDWNTAMAGQGVTLPATSSAGQLRRCYRVRWSILGAL
ncbi:hypothetical protein DPMN_067204 [Dreissena polymorpha]|uniref:Uncharacterized protein n=1 Tax=Dreissena polymorpha TaxID=45954 RepID=A0A9D3YVF0_DREPO|nr:hypothetical protein DPMN_067204 [Dreissena polymorpha]